MSPDDLLDLVRLGTPAASTDGSVVVAPIARADRETNRMVSRLHRLDGGALVPLTGDDASTPSVAPDGSAVAFLRPIEGEAQLHLLPMDGGEARALTDFPHGLLGAHWLPNGSGLIAVAPLARSAPDLEGTRTFIEQEKERQDTARVTEARLYRYWDRWLTDERTHHVFLVPLEGEPRLLSPGLDGWLGLGPMVDLSTQLTIAPDGSSVVVSAANAPHGGEGEPPMPRYALWQLALEEPRVRLLTPDHPGNDRGPVFVDARTLLFGAQPVLDDYSSPPVLTLLDLSSGDERPLTDDWDLTPGSWTVDRERGRALVVAEERARARLFAVDLETGERTRLTTEGSLGRPVLASDHVWATQQSISQPARLVRVPLGATGETDPEVVADPNEALLGELELGRVEELEVPGARGDAVQVFVVHPPGEVESPPPLVHMIHGGPHGTFGDVWHYRWNAHAFAAPGYVAALVNFHGSTSFGHESTRSIQGAWGEMPTEDVLAATDLLVERGTVDPERMAITGGSYGGYMCSWIPTRTDRFKCAVAHAAVTNLGAMLATDWTLGLSRGYGADPTADPERVARWSPAHHWKGHTTPTLVIHGEQDFRVPLTQGLELYGALKMKGVEARLIVYPDENHWVRSPANARHWYGEVHRWLARFLR